MSPRRCDLSPGFAGNSSHGQLVARRKAPRGALFTQYLRRAATPQVKGCRQTPAGVPTRYAARFAGTPRTSECSAWLSRRPRGSQAITQPRQSTKC